MNRALYSLDLRHHRMRHDNDFKVYEFQKSLLHSWRDPSVYDAEQRQDFLQQPGREELLVRLEEGFEQQKDFHLIGGHVSLMGFYAWYLEGVLEKRAESKA